MKIQIKAVHVALAASSLAVAITGISMLIGGADRQIT